MMAVFEVRASRSFFGPPLPWLWLGEGFRPSQPEVCAIKAVRQPQPHSFDRVMGAGGNITTLHVTSEKARREGLVAVANGGCVELGGDLTGWIAGGVKNHQDEDEAHHPETDFWQNHWLPQCGQMALARRRLFLQCRHLSRFPFGRENR